MIKLVIWSITSLPASIKATMGFAFSPTMMMHTPKSTAKIMMGIISILAMDETMFSGIHVRMESAKLYAWEVVSSTVPSIPSAPMPGFTPREITTPIAAATMVVTM